MFHKARQELHRVYYYANIIYSRKRNYSNTTLFIKSLRLCIGIIRKALQHRPQIRSNKKYFKCWGRENYNNNNNIKNNIKGEIEL